MDKSEPPVRLDAPLDEDLKANGLLFFLKPAKDGVRGKDGVRPSMPVMLRLPLATEALDCFSQLLVSSRRGMASAGIECTCILL
mmetsp:Transcript_34284/g.67502  ORF Transcript_34284/g.67502 Transcript_34284/m.67502 type:complete len:84 (+) Transcript_34284:1209-1460(+)